jgi:hypothetical protein
MMAPPIPPVHFHHLSIGMDALKVKSASGAFYNGLVVTTADRAPAALQIVIVNDLVVIRAKDFIDLAAGDKYIDRHTCLLMQQSQSRAGSSDRNSPRAAITALDVYPS